MRGKNRVEYPLFSISNLPESEYPHLSVNQQEVPNEANMPDDVIKSKMINICRNEETHAKN